MIDSFQAEQALRADLETGERLVWAGQPAQGLRLQAGDAFLIPFSLLWTGFVVFWEMTAIRSGAPLFFQLWGLPFLTVGLYLTIGRFYADLRRRARTYYGITDRRVLIRTTGPGSTLNSLALSGLAEISVQERGDGTGTILFGTAHPIYGRFAASGWPGMGRFQPAQLESIPDVKRVYRQLREVQDGAR